VGRNGYPVTLLLNRTSATQGECGDSRLPSATRRREERGRKKPKTEDDSNGKLLLTVTGEKSFGSSKKRHRI